MPSPRITAFIEAALAAETDDCIPWPADWLRNTYFEIRVDGVRIKAHRYICERAHGTPLPGREAAHSCNWKPCINKRHLRWATHRENKNDP